MVLALLIGCSLTVSTSELGLRFLLFSDAAIARRLGASLRRPENFADGRDQDDFWKLQYLFLDPDRRVPANFPDPVCGWSTAAVLQGTYEHVDASRLGGRRPVLLYGDSFAECKTPPADCFQGILEKSDLTEHYCLINYGVAGYGVDQMYLLIRQSIDRWRDLDPIVVVSFLVDNDFDRNINAFRCWPKPRFTIEGNQLVFPGPVELDPDAYLARNPPQIRSYLWRFLIFRCDALPESWQRLVRRRLDRRAEKVALGRKILEEIHGDLESRGLRHFFLAFHGELGVAGADEYRWVEELIDETARALGVRVISTRPFLLAAAGGQVARTAPFFGGSRELRGHYNDLGNLVAFEALRAGIEGKFDPVDTSRAAAVLSKRLLEETDREVSAGLFGRDAKIRTRGRTGMARMSSTPYLPFDAGSKEAYLLLRAGEAGATEIHVAVDGQSRHLRGRAMSLTRPDRTPRPDPMRLTVRIDGRTAVHASVPFLPDGLDLDVDLSGASRLEIVAENPGADPASAWIHIAGARLE